VRLIEAHRSPGGGTLGSRAWLHVPMPWKSSINKALSRSLGIQLVRSSSLAELEAAARAPRPKKAKAERAQKQVQKPAPKPARKPARKALRLPADYGSEFEQVWDLVRGRTMTSHEKGYYLHQATRYVVAHQIPGAVVECGVWRGGSMLNVAHTLSRMGVRDRDLYLFDTFTGMSEPTGRDVHLGKQAPAATLLEQEARSARVWAIASLDDVREGFAPVDYPEDRIHFVEGKVEETIPGAAPEQIAILRLDTDWYESTKHEFEHLYSRLSPGGVLIIDDYGTWKGSKDATDEFLAETGEPLLLVRTGWGRAAVKPGLPGRVAGRAG